jgi:hypothetical protein
MRPGWGDEANTYGGRNAGATRFSTRTGTFLKNILKKNIIVTREADF